MTTPDLHSLLDRVRSAANGNMELDLLVVDYFGRKGKYGSPICAGILGIGDFSSSLDAVVKLIEEKLPGWQRASGTCGEQDMPWACLSEPAEPYRDFAADAPDEVLALLDALLQALIEVNHEHPRL